MAGNTTEAVKIVAAGSTVTTGAASADVALPNGSTGAKVRFYRFVTLAGGAHVKVGASGGSATTSDTLITTTATVLDCGGCTNYQHIQATAAQTLNVMPVEVG